MSVVSLAAGSTRLSVLVCGCGPCLLVFAGVSGVVRSYVAVVVFFSAFLRLHVS